jgi:hypothetical protein
VSAYRFGQPTQIMEVPEGNWQVELIFSGNLPERITCKTCFGRGSWTLWSDSTEKRDCPDCFGAGTVRNPAYRMPDPPMALVEGIRKLVTAEWNKNQNAKFKLEP